MKKRILGLLALIVLALVFAAPAGTTWVKAAEDVMAEYFPKGFEKVKPNKPIIDIDESDTTWISAIIKQNDDVLKLVRDYEECTDEVEFQNDIYDGYYKEFEVKYGILSLDTSAQFDISVDDGEWQYKKSWDKMEHDAYADGFTFYESLGNATTDNTINKTLMDAGPASEGKLLKQAVKNEKFDLKNHTFKVRYRYCIQYELLDDYDAGIQFYFSDWSDTTTFGKTTDQNIEIPDELPAPDISNPKRDLNAKGKWGGFVSILTHFSQEVTDTATAIHLKTGEYEPFLIVVEAAIDDPSEKKFDNEGYMANAVWLSDGQRIVAFDVADTFTDKSRILIRMKLHCDALDKDTKYDYAVDKVTGLKAKKTKTTSITLKWTKVSDAEFYEIYSADNKLLGTSNKNSFTVKRLKAGTAYDFKVRAVVDKVFVGQFSNTLKASTKAKKAK
ncbi:MAG: fibronectin type III domain-containing protein [Lachnospiraceae bacterium]|nr:fibronectin type III domain-containing protein [Lachnospiraceae bacterium]